MWLKAETQTGLSGDLIGGGGGGGANRLHIILSRKQTLASPAASVKRVRPSETDS